MRLFLRSNHRNETVTPKYMITSKNQLLAINDFIRIIIGIDPKEIYFTLKSFSGTREYIDEIIVYSSKEFNLEDPSAIILIIPRFDYFAQKNTASVPRLILAYIRQDLNM